MKSVLRAAELLKLLAREPEATWRLSDLARETGLGKTTAHRLLAALVETGLARQTPDSRRYQVGPALARLGSRAARVDLAELARPSLFRIARETEDTVFLSAREGPEAVCLDRQVGPFPIRTLTLDIGDRRPLGVGAGSLALLAFLPEAEREAAIAASGPALARYPGFGPETLRDLVAETRRRGHSFNDGRIVSGMCAIGVPVRDGKGRVVAAISVAAIRDRMAEARLPSIVALLEAEAAALSERIRTAAAPDASPL